MEIEYFSRYLISGEIETSLTMNYDRCRDLLVQMNQSDTILIWLTRKSGDLFDMITISKVAKVDHFERYLYLMSFTS